MKQNRVSKSDAINSLDQSSVCGTIDVENDVSMLRADHVKATRHGGVEPGACALPRVNYDVKYPVALGDIDSLQNLKFRPELCGHVLDVNCGHGQLDIVINNSNLGGGLDLYASTWDLLTDRQPPGETYCSVELSWRNAMPGGMECYYKPGTDHGKRGYHNVGLFNTNEKLVTGAVIGNKVGSHRGPNPYFAFDEVDDNAVITFSLSDGSSKAVSLRDCIYLNDEQVWS